MYGLEAYEFYNKQPQSPYYPTNKGYNGQNLRGLAIRDNSEACLEAIFSSSDDKKHEMDDTTGEEDIDDNKDGRKQDDGQKDEIQSELAKKVMAELHQHIG